MRLLRSSSDEHAAAHAAGDLYAEFAAGWSRIEIRGHDIHSTADGRIHATEALMWWRRAPGELWSAAMALPIAEEIGLIGRCTQRALDLSILEWSAATNRQFGGRLSLNLHRVQLEDPGIAAMIRELCDEHGVVPRELVLEIPDRLGPNGCRAAVDALGPLIDAGAGVALDDHRGAASKTRPDESWLPAGSLVKLDTAITSICDHHLGRNVMQVTADDLHASGYEVVAEMIERPAQLAAVIECGIGWAQGHLFARPAPMV